LLFGIRMSKRFIIANKVFRMKFTSDVPQRYFVGTRNQTSKLHFHCNFKQRPINHKRCCRKLCVIIL